MHKPYQIVPLQDCSDWRGNMHIISCGSELPFTVRRAFFMRNHAPDSLRGNHCNPRSRFGYVCMQGSFTFSIDDGQTQHIVHMSDPTQILITEPMLWKKLYDFTPDCILLVLSESLYTEDDYINDYDDFLQARRAMTAE